MDRDPDPARHLCDEPVEQVRRGAVGRCRRGKQQRRSRAGPGSKQRSGMAQILLEPPRLCRRQHDHQRLVVLHQCRRDLDDDAAVIAPPHMVLDVDGQQGAAARPPRAEDVVRDDHGVLAREPQVHERRCRLARGRRPADAGAARLERAVHVRDEVAREAEEFPQLLRREAPELSQVARRDVVEPGIEIGGQRGDGRKLVRRSADIAGRDLAQHAEELRDIGGAEVLGVDAVSQRCRRGLGDLGVGEIMDRRDRDTACRMKRADHAGKGRPGVGDAARTPRPAGQQDAARGEPLAEGLAAAARRSTREAPRRGLQRIVRRVRCGVERINDAVDRDAVGRRASLEPRHELFVELHEKRGIRAVGGLVATAAVGEGRLDRLDRGKTSCHGRGGEGVPPRNDPLRRGCMGRLGHRHPAMGDAMIAPRHQRRGCHRGGVDAAARTPDAEGGSGALLADRQAGLGAALMQLAPDPGQIVDPRCARGPRHRVEQGAEVAGVGRPCLAGQPLGGGCLGRQEPPHRRPV